MKTIKILKLTGIVLMGLILTAQVEAAASNIPFKEKKALTLTVDKPVIEFMAKAYSEQIDSNDIIRLQKVAGKIDRVVISFRDKEASDYVLTFKPLDENGLEAWMFNAGYLSSEPEAVPVSQELNPAAEPADHNVFRARKKAVDLTVDTPIIEYLSRIYAGQIESEDIVRLQKICRQIDHITVTFRDEDAVDYVLKFKCLDDKALEEWMYHEGYTIIAKPEPSPEPAPVAQWMLNFKDLK